ncbi:hypothetical protein LTR10_011281 [Elasticomyces elasticus]|nr:hypothetical protein LTR10_011281 [Elasticomyces elasticus]KAK4966304.1 hypothetical protein LTR42_011465 [Elasticomyces elasticus]
MTGTKRSLEADGVEVAASSKQTKMDYTDLIRILVGAEESRFVVHKDAICGKSPFFNAACGREWREGQEKCVRLPEQDAGAFRVYLRWVYGDTLEMSQMPEPDGMADPPSFLNLNKVWMLSRYLQDDDLCNRINDCAIRKIQLRNSGLISKSTLQHCFEHNSTESAIGRLFLDALAASSNAAWFALDGQGLPSAVLFDMARKFAGGEQKRLPTMKDRCNYHIHPEGQARCS